MPHLLIIEDSYLFGQFVSDAAVLAGAASVEVVDTQAAAEAAASRAGGVGPDPGAAIRGRPGSEWFAGVSRRRAYAAVGSKGCHDRRGDGVSDRGHGNSAAACS